MVSGAHVLAGGQPADADGRAAGAEDAGNGDQSEAASPPEPADTTPLPRTVTDNAQTAAPDALPTTPEDEHPSSPPAAAAAPGAAGEPAPVVPPAGEETMWLPRAGAEPLADVAEPPGTRSEPTASAPAAVGSPGPEPPAAEGGAVGAPAEVVPPPVGDETMRLPRVVAEQGAGARRKTPAPGAVNDDGAETADPGPLAVAAAPATPTQTLRLSRAAADQAAADARPPADLAVGTDAARPAAAEEAAATAEDAAAAPGPAAPAFAEAPTDRFDRPELDDLPAEFNPRRRRRRRGLFGVLALVVAGLVSAGVFLAAGLGYTATTYYETKIDRVDLGEGKVEGARPTPLVHGKEAWLLVGSDVRTGSDKAAVSGARSDTMMIAYLGANGSTTMVSIPRDLKVTIPAYTDSKGKHHASRTDKVNAAFSLGGPALLLRTLENVSGLRIDHFAEIDFGGFKQMSSALGGVQVCLVSQPYTEYFTNDKGRRVKATNLNDPNSGFLGHAGMNTLTGDNALAFVRQRHGFADGDLSRIRRQQAFLAAVFRQVNSGDLLTNPVKFNNFLSAVTSATVLDEDTSLTDLKSLAERMRGLSSGQVHFTTIPLTGQVASPVFYFFYSPTAVRGFFQQIEDDNNAPLPGSTPAASTPTAGPTPSATPTPALDRSEVKVNVLNGTRTAGKGGTVAVRLRGAGYQVVGRTGITEDRDTQTTEIHYAPGDEALAARLAADIAGARTMLDENATTGRVTLIVGQDTVPGSVVAAATTDPGTDEDLTPTDAPKAYYTQAPVTADTGCVA